jgi:hypothetical protein
VADTQLVGVLNYDLEDTLPSAENDFVVIAGIRISNLLHCLALQMVISKACLVQCAANVYGHHWALAEGCKGYSLG